MPRIERRARVSAPRKLEGEIVTDIRLALDAEPDLELWRNGVAGVKATDAEGNTRHSRAGLPRGSSDLIGVLAVTFELAPTPFDPPRPEPNFEGPRTEEENSFETITIGRLVCLEVKRPDVKVKPLDKLEAMRRAGKVLSKKDLHDYEQQLWMMRVRAKGGFACYVRSVEEARAAIERARKGKRE